MRVVLILSVVLLAGCARVSGVLDRVLPGTDRAAAEAPERPVQDAPLPPAAQDAPEAAPVPAVPSDGRGLGRTVAGLGDPGRTGLWLETPLVEAGGAGRVDWPRGGSSAAVTLIPAEGAVTAGSRLSLEAFRALGAPLTELIEIEVYAGG